MRNRRLLTVGTPVPLANLRVMLDAVDTVDPNKCIVRHAVGQLIVEEPQPELSSPTDEASS